MRVPAGPMCRGDNTDVPCAVFQIALTRKQLYQRVWETPIDTLRKEFGISNVGLGKICRHSQIPVPPRGYWAKKYCSAGASRL